MARLQFVASRGVLGNGSPSSTATRTVTVNADIAPGAVVIVRCASENPSAETGETDRHSLADSLGHDWEKVGEGSQPFITGPSNGLTVSLWWCRTANGIPSGTTITVTFEDACGGGAISVAEFDPEDVENEPVLVKSEVVTATTVGSPPQPWSVTVNLDEPLDITWIGAAGHSQGVTTVGLDASFTTDRDKHVVNGGNHGNNTSHWGQYRHLLADTETWNGTLNSNRPYVAILAAFRVDEPPPPPSPPGVREYRSDFDTPGHQTIDATIDPRLDAILPDPRVAFTPGPIAVADLSQGQYSHVWRFRADDTAIYYRRVNDDGTDWGPEVVLWSYSGEPIVELWACFDIDGRPVVVCERHTGEGGAPHIFVLWWDVGEPVSAYVMADRGEGWSPRCVSDYFPIVFANDQICPPEAHVQVFHVKDGVGVVRRESSDDFVTTYPSVMATSKDVKLQLAFRTTDRRISVLFGLRNRKTGRWQHQRLDSVPYSDSLIRRPNFVNWTDPGGDVMRALGVAAWSDAVTTGEYILRVQTQDECDAIEVAASADYPFGSEPPFDQQAQEVGGGFIAGGFHDFSFEITHGGGNCSLVAFRARVRRTVGEITCYSPWRYTIIPPSAFTPPGGLDEDINCDRDLLLNINDRLSYFVGGGIMEARRETDQSARLDPRPFMCTEGEPIFEAPLGWWFVGGSQNHEPSFPFPTHIRRYSWRVRGLARFQFYDGDVTLAGIVVGDVMSSGGGSPPTEPNYVWPATRFPLQFPDDTGVVPPVGYSDDVIGSTDSNLFGV